MNAVQKKVPAVLNGSILLTKRELLYLCNTGQLRVLTGRVCDESSNPDRLFAVGLSTSPVDVDNCCIVRLQVTDFAKRVDKTAIKKDLFVLEVRDVQTIAPIKKVDSESLVSLVNERYQGLFTDPIEDRWRSWMQSESVRIHRRSFGHLLKWSGQKGLSRADSADPRIENLIAESLGHESHVKPDLKDLSLRFLAEVKHLAENMGPRVGTVTSPFHAMDVWEKLVGPKSSITSGAKPEKVPKSLLTRSKEPLSFDGLKRGALLSKLRKRQRDAHWAYNKEVQPIMMSCCLYANYRLTGGVFTVDHFSEALQILRQTEKDRAAWLYTLFIASRLEPDVVYLHTSGSGTDLQTELFPRNSV